MRCEILIFSPSWREAWTNGAAADHGYTAGKRGLDDEADFPAKRLKQLLHEGYIMHGQEWANQAFQNGNCATFARISLRVHGNM